MFPDYSFPIGTRLGTVIVHKGLYDDKLVCFKDNNDQWMRMNIRTYGRPRYLWTGYRWMNAADSETNATNIRRDYLRAKAGRQVIDNEWV